MKGKNSMNQPIPEFLKEKLISQYGGMIANKIIEGYAKRRPVTLRVNTLKTTIETVKKELSNAGIVYEEVVWSKEALIIPKEREDILRQMTMYKQGEIYLQSLSSMLPPILLNPQEGTSILDMAAAPGGKTTQMAAITRNNASITACEMNSIRAEKLKYNIEKQGATSVYVMLTDARRLDEYFSFDTILLDAPCSGSGTIVLKSDNSKNKLTVQLLQKSIKSQQQLLKKALSILKPGGEMVYSTCSILKEENEEIIKSALQYGKVEMIPIDIKQLEGVPMLPVTLEGTVSICPTELYEGFYVAKLKKTV